MWAGGSTLQQLHFLRAEMRTPTSPGACCAAAHHAQQRHHPGAPTVRTPEHPPLQHAHVRHITSDPTPAGAAPALKSGTRARLHSAHNPNPQTLSWNLKRAESARARNPGAYARCAVASVPAPSPSRYYLPGFDPFPPARARAPLGRGRLAAGRTGPAPGRRRPERRGPAGAGRAEANASADPWWEGRGRGAARGSKTTEKALGMCCVVVLRALESAPVWQGAAKQQAQASACAAGAPHDGRACRGVRRAPPRWRGPRAATAARRRPAGPRGAPAACLDGGVAPSVEVVALGDLSSAPARN